MARKKQLPEGMAQRPGRPGYYADCWIGGERLQRKLSDDFETARKILRQLKARADAAGHGLLDNDYSIEDLRAAYLQRCRQELAEETAERYRRSLEAILGWLKAVKVRDLTLDRVLDYRAWRLQHSLTGHLTGTSARTVNHDVGVLSSMLTWGASVARLIGSNPIAGVKPLPHEPKDGRPLSDDEVQRLLASSKPHWRDIWYAFLVTGLRSDELAALTFASVDWTSRELVVQGKGRKVRRVPIEDGLHRILERQRGQAAGRLPGKGKTASLTVLVGKRLTREHIFTTTQNTPLTHRSSLYGAFMRSLALAGIPAETFDQAGNLVEHVDVHSLRRTFATNAITNGADPKSVQEILGHSTLVMTMKVYTKVKAGPKRAAIARLSYGSGAQAPEHVLPMPRAQ